MGNLSSLGTWVVRGGLLPGVCGRDNVRTARGVTPGPGNAQEPVVICGSQTASVGACGNLTPRFGMILSSRYSPSREAPSIWLHRDSPQSLEATLVSGLLPPLEPGRGGRETYRAATKVGLHQASGRVLLLSYSHNLGRGATTVPTLQRRQVTPGSL